MCRDILKQLAFFPFLLLSHFVDIQFSWCLMIVINCPYYVDYAVAISYTIQVRNFRLIDSCQFMTNLIASASMADLSTL
jgi:hypothetical protein